MQDVIKLFSKLMDERMPCEISSVCNLDEVIEGIIVDVDENYITVAAADFGARAFILIKHICYITCSNLSICNEEGEI